MKKKMNHILFRIVILTLFLSAAAANASPLASGDGYPGSGDSQSSANLPSVTTKIVTQITATTAKTGGIVYSDGGGTMLARGVCWSTSQNPTIDDSHTVDSTGLGSFSSFITGLIPGQQYYVRAYATNSVGTSYGEELHFVTNCIPYETWDTLRISPSQLPYAYGDTVLDVNTPDSTVLSFNYMTMIGCDSLAHIKVIFTSKTVTACSEYFWSATGQTYQSSGTYLRPFTDGQGHDFADTLYLTILSPQVTLGDLPAVSVCENETLTLSANATGNGDISYNWTGPGNFTGTSNQISIPNAQPSMSGSYTVTASVTEGACTDTATKTVLVTVHPLPEVHIQGDAVRCQGESITLTATGANTYQWNSGATGASITQTPTVSMTFSVTGTDIHACQNSAMVFVTIHTLPNVGISGDNSICQGESTQLIASGAHTYAWSTGSTGTGILVSPSASTSYTVTGTDANGCSKTANVMVSVGQGSSDAMTVTACEAYTWYVNGTTYTESGFYTYNYTNASGCESSHTLNLTITHNETNEISVSKCDSYTWGVTNLTYTESGTYTVTSTTSAGCEVTDILHLTINHGSNTEESLTVCEPYTWAASGQTFTESGTHVFEYTNENGCPSSKTLHLTVLDASASLSSISPVTVCENQALSFSATATGTGDISYEWSGPNHFTSSNSQISIPNATSAMGGIYTVTATAQNGPCAASATTTVSVTVYPQPTVGISGGGSVCAGESVTLGANGAVSYLWNNGSTGTSVSESPEGSKTYSVTGTDANGCSAIATASVTVYPLPQVHIYGGAVICKGESVTLTATGAGSYQWSNGSTSNSITESPASSTTYTVMGTDINFCRNFNSVSVTVNELPVVTISGDDDICEGESTELSASGAKTYEWSNGSTAKKIIVDPEETTTYSVTGTDENDCSNSATFTVSVGEWSEDSVSVTACGSYYWHVTNQTYTHSGTYPFSYQNDAGCLSSHTLILTINYDETNETTVTRCDSYTWGVTGQTYTESGTYTYTFLNENQCQTTEILNLTINEGTHEEVTDQGCDDYEWDMNGQTYTGSGDYVFEYTNSNGCPSSATLHLTIVTGTEEEITETALDSYTWPVNGMTYTSSGDYIYQYTNEDGCDSKKTLHLTIKKTTPENQGCISARMEQEESCETGDDGIVSIYIPDSLKNKCTIKWTLGDNNYSSAERVTNLSKGIYHVEVKVNQPQHEKVIYQKNVEVTKEKNCEVKVHISGPTNLTGDCNGIPSATFTAYVIGGKAPFTFSPGWKKVSKTTAVRTINPGEGPFSVGCTVTDDNNDIGNDLLNGFAKKLECSQDPNEIKGPNGYSEESRFVSVSNKMNYTIMFENDPEFAMAPASRVKITYDVPEQQRIASFRLSDFGFGDFIFTVPSNASSYSQRLDVSDSLGVWVDVNAGIDIVNHQLFWIFQSIDPATGAEPASSQMGFLPINDSLEHGQGYVSFHILPENGMQTGDTVAASALIVFDENTPIGTNVWTNTFDAVAPVSTLHAEMNAADSLYCTFSFGAQDDPGGSGVHDVEVYVSINNEPYISIGSAEPDSTLSFALENGIYYQFMSIATDNVGNKEAFKPQADTSVNYNTAPINLVLDGNIFYEYDPVNSLIGTFHTLDNDVNLPFVYELVSGEGDTDNALFLIDDNSLRTATTFRCSPRTDFSIRVRTTDIGGLSLEKSFTLNEMLQHETPVTRLRREICMGGSVNFQGQTLTATGTYTDTLQTIDGCDSIVVLDLEVFPVFNATIANQICQGDTFNFNGQTLAEAGIYHDTLQTVDGCDSIITLLLTVFPVYDTIVAHSICAGESYNFFGTILTETGTYTDTVPTVNGCDSIVTLILTVNPTFNTPASHVMCQGESYNFFDTTLTTSGVYTHTLQSANGCDSLITLTLTVNPTYNIPIAEVICQGTSYNFFDSTLTTSGVYSHTLQTVNGCDSVITLTLMVTQPPVTHLNESICNGDSYTFLDTVLTTTGTYSRTLQTANGCDSIVTLHLTVNYSNTGTDVQTACDTYTWIDGNTYTESNNTATYTLTNAVGCDSVVTLNLTVNYSNTGVDVQTACDTYTWIDGNTYTESNNTATYTLTNAAGCDSVVTLNLTVNHSVAELVEATACDSYTWNGTTYTTSGEYLQTFTGANGCDSIVTLNLTVNHSNTGVDVQTACDSYNWIDGNTYTESNNTATYTLTNAAGCDSVVTLNLTVNHSNTGVDVQTACDSYTWIDGNTYTVSNNSATYTLTNAAGCDSVVTLNLTVNHSNTGVDVQTACDTYTWIDGNTYTESNNTATHTLTNAAGCDSVVTLNLTVNHSVAELVEATACDSYTWNGTTYTASGEYVQTFIAANGCDSVVTLNLTVNHSNTGVDVQTACDTYTWIDGNTYTESNNTATFTLTNAAGCDSVVTLNLTVNHSNTGVDVQTACDTYTWIDGNTYTESNSTATYTLTNAAGCDSVVTLNLTVNHSNTGVDVQTACDTYTWIDGNIYTESNNTATYTLTNSAGCDSVVTLNLTVNHSNTGVDVQMACDTYTWIDGNTYTESNSTATYTLTNAAGCDSVVTLLLTVNHSSHNVETETACESFTWHDSTYTTSGVYTYVYTNPNGCASIDTLLLTVNHAVAELVEVTACDNYTWNGSTYTTSGEYSQTFTGANGCDSVVTMDLTINYATVSDFSITTADSCYEWNTITYCETGDYTQTLQTVDGCDSVVTMHLTITVGIDDHDLSGIEVFPNPTNRILNIKGEDMRRIDLYNADGQLVYTKENNGSDLVQVDVSRFAFGQYFVKVLLDDGRIATRKVIVNRR